MSMPGSAPDKHKHADDHAKRTAQQEQHGQLPGVYLEAPRQAPALDVALRAAQQQPDVPTRIAVR